MGKDCTKNWEETPQVLEQPHSEWGNTSNGMLMGEMIFEQFFTGNNILKCCCLEGKLGKTTEVPLKVKAWSGWGGSFPLEGFPSPFRGGQAVLNSLTPKWHLLPFSSHLLFQPAEPFLPNTRVLQYGWGKKGKGRCNATNAARREMVPHCNRSILPPAIWKHNYSSDRLLGEQILPERDRRIIVCNTSSLQTNAHGVIAC